MSTFISCEDIISILIYSLCNMIHSLSLYAMNISSCILKKYCQLFDENCHRKVKSCLEAEYIYFICDKQVI